MKDKVKFAYIFGVLLASVASFLPWQCFGDIPWICTRGIELNLNFARFTLMNVNEIIMALVVMVVLGLLLSQLDLSAGKRQAIAFAAVFLLIALGTFNQFIIDNGGLQIVILSSIAIWFVFRAPGFFTHSQVMTLAAAIVLTTWATFHLVRVLLRHIVEWELIGGTTLQYGLPIVFIGSLIFLIRSIQDRRSISQRAG